ncbi:MAG: MBL fold metallo-hydrolase [Frankiaceae bacterium]|nr:MBL fold metallo-hydrolase [Frankiaceae bacterium]
MTVTAHRPGSDAHPGRKSGPAALTFLGGAGTVTGSKTLLSVGAQEVLVDCGLFQGGHDLRRRNWDDLGVAPGRIGAVLLTHAHLDHCGYVPKLCSDGFLGPVLATRATARLVEVVLLDSAHLLEEEAQHAAAHGWSKHSLPRPLYTSEDAQNAVGRLTAVPFDTSVEVAAAIRGTWRPAGHILGSATVHVEIEGGASILFSGDLGRQGHPLLKAPAAPPAADVVVVESTYGQRKHQRRDPARLADAINRTVARGGSVLIPAFAVDRTEVLLCALKELVEGGAIPRVPVFVDSPMALRALGIYREALDRQDPDVRSLADDPFDLTHLQALTSVEQSMTVNSPRYPSIVISASGMASGGRVLHHLKHQLPDPRNTVVLVGFQAAGTRGRALQEGARLVKIHGHYVPVRAEVVDLEEYSVHADADDVLAWLGSMPAAPSSCFVTHGEPDASAALRERIEAELGWLAVVPRSGERVLCT